MGRAAGIPAGVDRKEPDGAARVGDLGPSDERLADCRDGPLVALALKSRISPDGVGMPDIDPFADECLDQLEM